MNEKLAQALGFIDADFITRAAKKRRTKKVFLSAVAAILALILLMNMPAIPFVITAKAVALAEGTKIPDREDGFNAYWAAREKYEKEATRSSVELREFYRKASAGFLADETQNRIWSPANAAVALAVLAETASGSTRQEVLDLLGVSDVEILRAHISALWESSNKTWDHNFSTIANSLWITRMCSTVRFPTPM